MFSCKQKVIQISYIDSRMTKRTFTWQSQSNLHEEHLLAIRRMHDSKIRNNPIILDESMSEPEMRVNRRAQRLIETSEEQNISQYPNIEAYILDKINLECDKFAQFDSGSDHSSDEELQLVYNIEDIVDLANKDPTPGKITFVAKLIKIPGCDIQYAVKNTKPPGHKKTLEVQQIRQFQNFGLYQISTDSSHKRIALHLMMNGATVRKTEELNFSSRAIYLNLDLSHNFQMGIQLRMNSLEGLLAVCILEGEQLSNQIMELNGKKGFKQAILSESYTIDKLTQNLIEKNRNKIALIRLLKYFAEQEGWVFGKVGQLSKKGSFSVIVKIFLEQMLRFKLLVNTEADKLSSQEILSLFQMYLHFVCAATAVRELNRFGLSEQLFTEMKNKIGEVIEYCFRIREVKLYHKLMSFCLVGKNYILPVGYDTVKQFISECGLNSANIILATFENILYNVIKNKATNAGLLLIDALGKLVFESGNIYSNYIKAIEFYGKELFASIDYSALSFQKFGALYHIYYMFSTNKQLASIARIEIFRTSLVEYMGEFTDKLSAAKDADKIAGIALLEQYFINQRDEELKGDETLSSLMSTLIGKYAKNQKISEALVRLYFEMLKRTGVLFEQSLIRSLSKSLNQRLFALRQPSSSLNLINKYFKDDILYTKLLVDILTETLLTPIINKWLQAKKTVEYINQGNNNKWNHDFCYSLYINEMIVERVLRVVNQEMGDRNQDRRNLIYEIKRMINLSVTNQEQRNSLNAIIDIQEIELSYEKVLSYLTEQRSFLKTLLKISRKSNNEQRRAQLMKSLIHISQKLKQRALPFEAIQRIQKMKPNQWNTFVELTNDYELPNCINELYRLGDSYVNTLIRLKDFVREVGRKFNSPNTEQVLKILDDCLSRFERTAMKHQDLQYELPFFKNFKMQILKCCKLSSFYGCQDLEGKSIEQIVRLSHQLMVSLRGYIKNIYNDCQKKTLKSSSFYYFHPRKDSLDEFTQILEIIDENVPDEAVIVTDIYNLISISDVLYEEFNAFTTLQAAKFKIRQPALIQFETICQNLKKEVDFNISDILQKYERAKAKLGDYKIDIEDKKSKEILRMFVLLSKNKNVFNVLKELQPHLEGIKEKVNDIGGEVNNEQLQFCGIALEFMNTIYHKNFDQMNDYLGSIVKFCEGKRKLIKYFNLAQTFNTIVMCSKKLMEEKANFLDNSRPAVKIIDQVVRKVTFQFKLDEQNKDKIKSSIFIYPENEQSKQVPERQLYESKQKALMISSSTNEEDKERMKKIPVFLDICKSYQAIKEKEQQLTDWGYRQFKKQSELIKVVDGNTKQMKSRVDEKEVIVRNWKKKIDQIYENNFKAAHLQGKKLSEFYGFISQKESEIPPKFMIINDSQQVHREVKANIKITEGKTPEECLQNIGNYFKTLKQKVGSVVADDRDKQFVHLKLLPKGDVDFLRGIEDIDPKRIQNLRFEHLLICTKQTKMVEIRSFVQRALRDPDNQYIMLGYQNLDMRMQKYMIDQITAYRRDLKDEKNFRLKLCLVGDSQIELLYRFAQGELTKSEDVKNLGESKNALDRMLLKQAEKMLIVTSEKAGLGKSTFIKEHSLKKYQCKNQCYLPLTGNMFVPSNNEEGEVECSRFLWDRFEDVSLKLNEAEKRAKMTGAPIDTCLVLEIYNIEADAIESVNKLLLSLIICRQYGYDSNFGRIPSEVPIYIELQNISNSVKSDKKLKNSEFPIQINTLPILKQLWKLSPERFVFNIKSFDVEQVVIDKSDLQLNYVLNFLKCLKDKTIDSKYLKPFGSADPGLVQISEVQGRRLIKECFFDRFSADDQPSGYLWSYFRSLLFAAVSSFSNSIFLSSEVLKGIDDNLMQFNKPLHLQMKLKETFRGEFLAVIVQNCFDFIQRSVKPGAEGSASALQQTLKEMPLLIIPNMDNSSFSFIYNNSSKVPKVIKNLIVLQNFKLFNRVGTTKIDVLFEEENLAKKQKDPNEWKVVASEILRNISGNREYIIDCEPGYVVNIDNFFKICLIVQRMRLNIPIVIMGEAGIGKTALLRHVVKNLFKHDFKVFNINAGLPLISVKGKQAGLNQNISLSSMIEELLKAYEPLKDNPNKKLWVFFDEFNTLREVGFFKQIIMDKRFLGRQETAFKNCVMMAACNPHKKLEKNPEKNEQTFTLQKEQKLAFDVLPAPHSLIESMWNYGALSEYEYEKYIRKMLCEITYRTDLLSSLILDIHKQIKDWLYASSVSLRDIERLRQLYRWFNEHLPVLVIKNIPGKLGLYNNKEVRAVIMSLYFTYLLRFNQNRRVQLQRMIQKSLSLANGFVRAAKEVQQSDFCQRLNIRWDFPLVFNDSLKENIYTGFVCLLTKLPLIIIGSPGCSKSLSLRLLAKNVGKCEDEFIKSFKPIRSFSIQGSQNTTTANIKQVFDRAHGEIAKMTGGTMKLSDLRESLMVVFDEIGLAEKSPDNPLKVLHPYLEVNRDDNMDERLLGFIGISNSELDVSKMSRLLVLRRPKATIEDLKFTARGIASKIVKNYTSKLEHHVEILTETYCSFLQWWIAAKNKMFRQFYGLRDFYGLIKKFMQRVAQRQKDSDDERVLIEFACEAIFENFNGWEDSVYEFTRKYFDKIRCNDVCHKSSMNEIVANIKAALTRESYRFPMVIAEDEESMSFIKWMIEEHFNEKYVYIEGSPFNENKDYSLMMIGEVFSNMQFEKVLVVNNLTEGTKTGLYQFFNKSFNLAESTGKRSLRLRVKNGFQSKNYNQRFNCLYLMLRKDIENTEPPFLNRFQKCQFSLKDYMRENCSMLVTKLENFRKRIEEICVSNNLKHYTFDDLFINVSQKAIESLAVASYEFVKSSNYDAKTNRNQLKEQDLIQKSYLQAIKRLILNSGQQFYFLFKFVIEKSGSLPDIKQLINQVMSKKNEMSAERSLLIRFTNEKSYMTKYEGKKECTCLVFQSQKANESFREQIANFFKDKQSKGLYIFMKVLKEAKNLNYVLYQIEKQRKRAIAQKLVVDDKRVRVIYLFSRGNADQYGHQQKDMSITHFSSYGQQFDDGKVGEMGGSKEQMFTSIINMEELLKYVHEKAFEFSLENPVNAEQAQKICLKIRNEFQQSKNGLFRKSCEQVSIKLQTNFQLGEENIKSILMDEDLTKKSQTFKVAVTRYFADKKFFGAVAVFIKYLIDTQSYLAYSDQFLFEYINSEAYQLNERTVDEFRGGKRDKNYGDLVKQVLKNKIVFILGEYQKLKNLKRLPTSTKKYLIKMSKPRLIPYSKVQCEMLLNCEQKSLGWYAKQIYKNPERAKQAFDVFSEELKLKTTFKNARSNYYAKFIDEDKTLKKMLFFDLLHDFAESRGLPTRYIEQFYQLMLPALGSFEKVKFQKIVAVLLGFQEMWIEIFKVMSVFYGEECEINVSIGEMSNFDSQKMIGYLKGIIKQVENFLLSDGCIRKVGGADKFSRVYLNVLFQMQKLQSELRISLSGRLKSIRAILVFLEIVDATFKDERIEKFMTAIGKLQGDIYYQKSLNFFDCLMEGVEPEKQRLITEFKANTLFFQWFNKASKVNPHCLQSFIKNCENQTFAHNSVATINHWVEFMKPIYLRIMQTFRKLNNTDGKEERVVEELIMIGKDSLAKKMRDNLSIVITNMFMQKINAEFEKRDIIKQTLKQFQQVIQVITSSPTNGVSLHFAFAYIKVFLQNYIDRFVSKQKMLKQFEFIDNILSKKQNIYCANFRFYCLKLLRTKMTIKQIFNDYVKLHRSKWIGLIDQIDLFLENQSRSFIVPQENKKVSDKLRNVIASIINKEGKPDQFDALFQEGSNSPFNRYCLLTFFFKYYYSMVFNFKAHRGTVLDKLKKEKAKYEKLIGERELDLIVRYASGKFDQRIKLQKPEDFTQDLFFLFNPVNWLLATRQAVSPLGCLFFQNGKFHASFKGAFEGYFFPCGPENPFINIAQSVYEMTRSNNIGVYKCSSQCDYLYSHLNCGWPNETSKCQICGQIIGCKPGKGHTIARDDQGGRRVMSTFLKDNGNFYVSSLANLPLFYDCQRCYIESEMNKMKTKDVITMKDIQIKLKGYQVQNQGRISTLTYYIFRSILHAIFYVFAQLKIIPAQECSEIFKGKDLQECKKQLWQREAEDIVYIKKALNLDKKIYGWIYGVHNFVFELSLNFQKQFNEYRAQIESRAFALADQLTALVTENKVKNVYFDIYKDIANALKTGLITGELNAVTSMTAENRFTRDAFEELLEKFIKRNTTEEKFNLSQANVALQGKVQFPHDGFLTEDEIMEEKFQYSRLLKLPDKVIKYSEIVVNFELLIREKYPFLDYILKNSETINSMSDFYTVISFSNQLFAEVQNTYERKDAERGLGDFIKELKEKKQNKLHEVLANPKTAVEAWNRLAKKLGVLQNNCTKVGKMNDEYSLNTEVKAFLIDNVSKKNPYGLILSSVFHNFAIMHNDLTTILNSRKNQIAQYKCLSLYNQSKKVSPQRIRENEVYMITQKQLTDKLVEFSLSSISYGKNFIFTNFESYQRYFLMKLQGKCEILSVINDFKSICFNGEAFAQTSESSNTLTEVRDYFYEPLDDKERQKVHKVIKFNKNFKEVEECSVRVRGQLEQIMIAIKKLNGIVEEPNLNEFVINNHIDINSEIVEFFQFPVSKIVPLYELVELEMKVSLIDKLPDQYKKKLAPDAETELTNLFNELPLENDAARVTLEEFGYALYRFMARNLQGGILQKERVIMQFLPYRQDFWPKDFAEEKKQELTGNFWLSALTLQNVCALFQIVDKMVQKKVGASRI